VEAEGRAFPRVWVGVAYGAASNRGGDWFGAPVNLASRITDVTRPGQIFADESVRDRAEAFAWKRKRRQRLKGIARPVRLSRWISRWRSSTAAGAPRGCGSCPGA
jgi:adenylate cyclase